VLDIDVERVEAGGGCDVAISIERVSRTVIEATTSSRANFSLTRLRRISRSSVAIRHPPALSETRECVAAERRRQCAAWEIR